jgi:hypothetical protein
VFNYQIIAKFMNHKYVPKGQLAYKQGEVDQALHILMKGVARIYFTTESDPACSGLANKG